MNIKNLLPISCAGLTAVSVLAGPLDLSTVARDSKWLVHLDVEAFRATRIGSHVLEKILQPKLDDADEIKEMNLSINLQNISSLTAYGPDFDKKADGALLVRTTADVKKDLDTLSGMSSLSGSGMLALAQLKPYPVYSFRSNVFIAPNIENMVIVAKSREQIENVRKVLQGKGETMAQNKSFADYPKSKNAFFFLGMAEGFNENASIPPQAQVLKETRGGRLVVGENSGKVFANLVFRSKNEESALKIQQVFQGIVALVSLSQENQDLTDLARSAQIASDENNVTINLQFPVAKAIEHLNEEMGD